MFPQKEIENQIFTLHSSQVITDRDSADMYGVETKVLNQAVERNIELFPSSFRFQITQDELNNLSRSQIVTLNNVVKTEKTNRAQNIKYFPYVLPNID